MENKITLVIPAKNEADSLPKVLKELKKFKFKISIVLERSDQKTIESIKKFKNKKLIFQKNKGYGDALRLGIKKVKLIPDGDGGVTRQLGMLVDKPGLNFGLRSWRHSSLVVNGIVKKMFVEEGINNQGENGDPYEVSDPQTMLDYVKSL